MNIWLFFFISESLLKGGVRFKHTCIIPVFNLNIIKWYDELNNFPVKILLQYNARPMHNVIDEELNSTLNMIHIGNTKIGNKDLYCKRQLYSPGSFTSTKRYSVAWWKKTLQIKFCGFFCLLGDRTCVLWSSKRYGRFIKTLEDQEMMTKAFGKPCEHGVILLAQLKSFISFGHVNWVLVFSVDMTYLPLDTQRG